MAARRRMTVVIGRFCAGGHAGIDHTLLAKIADRVIGVRRQVIRTGHFPKVMIDHQILGKCKAGIDMALRRGKPVPIQRRVSRAFGAAEAGIATLKQLAQPVLRIRITRFGIAQKGAASA